MVELTKEDLDLIEQALLYAKKNVAESSTHPSYDFKQQQLRRADEVLDKIRALKRASPAK